MKRLAISVLLVLVAVTLTACTPAPPSTPDDFALVQYPDAGFTGLYDQTRAAAKSIDMEMYELSDPTEEEALIAAAHRGVLVRVLLDSAYEEKQYNEPAYSALARGHVQVRWASVEVIFHIKTVVFDGTAADISSANLTSRYYATTRDATVIDTYPVHVGAIEKTFQSDWDGGSPAADTTDAPGLVWSPGAESAFVAQIDNATTSIDFTSEELSDDYIVEALVKAAERGIRCRIAMVDQNDWHPAFARVTAAGCQVHVVPDTTNGFYIHEKLLITDAGTPDARFTLGSQNASYSSLVRNRELSVQLSGAQAPDVITAAEATFEKDFSAARPWH